MKVAWKNDDKVISSISSMAMINSSEAYLKRYPLPRCPYKDNENSKFIVINEEIIFCPQQFLNIYLKPLTFYGKSVP